ncbi:MAG: hypothetical protein JNM03_06375 [Sphingopyxis sp.]|uniref:hypothetical protein n=1 Tax=Sphingopyxis sp. TaxID=1908224 RepID=UPI001A4D4494|nr:hypothetical protein [Sphingopyxis sp.]MBL9069605.1 hypothetical protein [Sphingopyxis sp.]
MTAAPSVATIIGDAGWLAHRYDPGHDAFHFRRVSRDARAEVPFLTDQYLGEESAPVVLRRSDCRLAAASPEPPLHFLLHSAYCASTMLVQAFDRPGVATGLSEPVLLNDMVGWRRRGAEPRAHGRAMDDALAMLARPLTDGEAVIVKPSNIFNPLARGALMLRPQARALLLHAPLRAFLLSVARKGIWCRLWCRELLESYLADGYVQLGFEPRDYFRQSDLQVAAVGWLAQQQAFAAFLDGAPDRFASLDSETLTADPVAAVTAALAHYGLPADRDAIAAHPALGRNSKSGATFAAGERQRDLAAAEAAYGEEIDQVIGWAEVVAARFDIPLALPRPLLVR